MLMRSVMASVIDKVINKYGDDRIEMTAFMVSRKCLYRHALVLISLLNVAHYAMTRLHIAEWT